MRNRLKHKDLTGRPAARALVALSLTASLAAFGCTTNRTPGSGDPYRSGPGLGPATAPTAGVGGTSSSGTVSPIRASRLPLSPDEAAAVMAGQQFKRGVKVLGPVNPGPSTQAYGSTGLVTGAYSAVAGGAAGPIVPGTTTTNGVTTGNATVGGTTGTIATPTNAGVPVTAGAFAAGPSVTTSATPSGVTAVGNPRTLTPSAVSSAAPSPTATSGTVVRPVISNASGPVTVTNPGPSNQQ